MVERIGLLRATDEELEEYSRQRQLALSLEEMKTIKEHFSRLGRDPTDVELETLAQTWSEHCVHKTFTGNIMTEEGQVKNLLKETVARVTRELNPKWCFSVFEDNAGIVDFDGDIAVGFKVETHNHPSALEPFGGAATGVGGVIRDILGVWGEPIANTIVLCFGTLDFPYEKLPPGTKHPSFIYKYVVAGIGTYGNNMGIPTVNGSIFFHEGYTGNPLVYCGTLGLVPKSRFVRDTKPGDIPLLVGGKTGKDGIHGVTFASAELSEESEGTSVTAVQIGDPIQEEKTMRGLLRVRDEGLASGITDLGGGGLSSAIGEMAARSKCGCMVQLEKVPLKYSKMRPWEIWCSESQERMLISLPPKNLERVLEIFSDEDVEATPVGTFTKERTLRIEFGGEVVADIDIGFMFDAVPKVERKAEWKEPRYEEPRFEMPGDLTRCLMDILSSPNVASKESVIRTYDHEVRGATVLKPLQGVGNEGPGDAAVLKPLPSSWKGIAISNGLNPEYGLIDPYSMAASAVDEAIRNNVSVGGRRIALLDNFSWGNPEKPDRLAGLVRAARACYDCAIAFETPFISGKDSLYNESAFGTVPPTLLISAVGIVPDVRKAVSMDAKEAGNAVYLLGETHADLGGSHYLKVLGVEGGRAPGVNPKKAKRLFDALTSAIDAELVRSCHDLSEGGLAVSAAEMAFAGDVGIELQLEKVPTSTKMRPDWALFSESNSRFLVEVEGRNAEAFEKVVKGTTFARIGQTISEKRLEAGNMISAELQELKERWQAPLRW